MIGSILSMKFVGHKSWKASIVFWIVYFVAMMLIGAATAGYIEYAGLVVSAIVFILLAKYWYKFNWFDSLKIFAVAFVIDIILIYLIVAVLGIAFFFSIPAATIFG